MLDTRTFIEAVNNSTASPAQKLLILNTLTTFETSVNDYERHTNILCGKEVGDPLAEQSQAFIDALEAIKDAVEAAYANVEAAYIAAELAANNAFNNAQAAFANAASAYANAQTAVAAALAATGASNLAGNYAVAANASAAAANASASAANGYAFLAAGHASSANTSAFQANLAAVSANSSAASANSSAVLAAGYAGNAQANALAAQGFATQANASAASANASSTIAAGYAANAASSANAAAANAIVSQQWAANAAANAASASSYSLVAAGHASNAAANAIAANSSAASANSSAAAANASSVIAANWAANAAANAASAAGSANAAQANAVVAQNAAANASANAASAQASATLAANYAANAQANAVAANASAASANSSAASANASAILAAGYAANALNSANAAQSNAIVAQQWAANAAANAASASASQLLAAGYATSAASASQSIGLTKNAQYVQGIVDWIGFYTSPASNTSPTSIGTATNYQGASEVVLNNSNARQDLRGSISPIIANRRYRLRARYYVTAAAAIIFGVTKFDSDGTFANFTHLHNPAAGSVPLNTWNEVNVLIDNATVLDTYAMMAPYGLTNLGSVATTIAIDYLFLEDVTESESAAGSALSAQANAVAANASAAQANSSAASANASSVLAAGYATSANNSANAAANSAAQSSANAAVAQQWAANASANAASANASASLAAGYASGARTTAIYLLPSTFEQDGTYFFNGYQGNPASQTALPGTGSFTFATVAGIGRVLQYNGTAKTQDVGQIGVISIQPGRQYRTTVTHRTLANTRSFSSYLIGMNASYSYVAVDGNRLTVTSNTTWQTSSVTVSGDSMIAAGIAYARTLSRFNAGAETGQVSQILIEDVTDSFNSQANAIAANASAVAANSSAASASSSAILAASIGFNALNKNPGFDNYPSATVGQLPTDWGNWAGSGTMYRVNDAVGGYSLRMPAAANTNAGVLFIDTINNQINQNSYYVIEADVTLNSGTFAGAGVAFHPANAAGSIIQVDLMIDFDADPDATGAVIGAGTAGQLYQFRKLVRVTVANTVGYRLYAMGHWTSAGAITAANDITWHKCLVRAATPQEIAAGVALPALQANVAVIANTVATHDTRLATYLIRTAAGNTSAEISFVALSNAGVNASSIGIRADTVTLGNSSTAALSISNGVSTFTGELNVGTGSGARVNITKDLIRVYDANNVMRVRLGVW